MLEGEPHSLTLSYTRMMMSFEAFLPHPREIALIGLGGGSIAKWCHRNYPKARFTAVEINPHVIAMGKVFGVPRASRRFRVMCEDGAKFVANPPNSFDLLLIDCFTTDSLPPELCSQKFFDDCSNALAQSSLLVANLCWKKHARIIARIGKSFSGQVLVAREPYGNTIVFACKGKLLWSEKENEASMSAKLKQFERKYKLGKALAPRG